MFEWWGVRDYSYHPDIRPFGASLRLFKIAPGDFVERCVRLSNTPQSK